MNNWLVISPYPHQSGFLSTNAKQPFSPEIPVSPVSPVNVIPKYAVPLLPLPKF